MKGENLLLISTMKVSYLTVTPILTLLYTGHRPDEQQKHQSQLEWEYHPSTTAALFNSSSCTFWSGDRQAAQAGANRHCCCRALAGWDAGAHESPGNLRFGSSWSGYPDRAGGHGDRDLSAKVSKNLKASSFPAKRKAGVTKTHNWNKSSLSQTQADAGTAGRLASRHLKEAALRGRESEPSSLSSSRPSVRQSFRFSRQWRKV